MSSITAQQTKLDLELVPKENRIDIGKCNGRIPRGLTPREPTFQVVLDAIALTPCYPAFLITADVPEVYMHQFWNSVYKHDTFYRFNIDKKKRFKLTLEVFRDIFQICPRVQGREFDPLPSEEDTVSFLKELCHTGEINSPNDVVVGQMHDLGELLLLFLIEAYQERLVVLTSFVSPKHKSFVTLSWRNKIGMHTSKDDYLINTLRFVSRKEASQIYGAVLPECLTSLEMKESKAYKTYLGYATGSVPPKIARKFKKASPTKKDSDLVPVDKEPVQKGKRVKRSAKKPSTTPAAGIDLLYEVALAEKAQLKEVRKKSLRDFHKTHPSGSGVPDVTEDDSIESESESWGNDEDDSNDEQESKDESSEHENESEEQESDDSEQEDESDNDNQEEEEVNQENESKDDDIESDEDKGMDDTTNQFDDDTTQEQVVEDAYVAISTVTKKTKVSATSSSRSSELASKILKFSDIPHTDAEIVSPFDVPVQHEVPNTQTTTLLPIHVYVITTIPQSLQTFTLPPLVSTPTPPPTTEATNPPTTLPDFASVFRFNDRITALEKGKEKSLTARIKEQVKYQLPQILPKEVSNFAPPVIKKLIKESRDEVTLAKGAEKTRIKINPSAGSKPGLKKERQQRSRTNHIRKRKDSTLALPKAPSLNRNLLESLFNQRNQCSRLQNSDMPQDQEGNMGDKEKDPRNATTF
ncbi:hypothetical protein Tco_0969375 [Tanacetum coccineum]